jgi:antitoxin CptB
MNDELAKRRDRLRFRSWHRGTKEMDLILGTFADKHLANFTSLLLDQYEEILVESDPDLYNWYAGLEALPVDKNSEVMQVLLQYRLKNNAVT